MSFRYTCIGKLHLPILYHDRRFTADTMYFNIIYLACIYACMSQLYYVYMGINKGLSLHLVGYM